MRANCCEEDDSGDDVAYKDVIIIGNGPSGICLSYVFAGNRPYYTGEPHPRDEMLTARLRFSTRSPESGETKSSQIRESNGGNGGNGGNEASAQLRGLAESTRENLECLCSGIEGRSGGRPLALLMDQLQHPCVDAGLDVPPLLVWRSVEQHPEHKIIDHVVLGKGQPGGAWQTMDPNVLTISLSRWMSLPDLDIRHWEMLVEAENLRRTNSLNNASHTVQEKTNVCKATSRVPVGTVAAYYKDYVRRKGLEKYFRSGTVVTSVRPLGHSPPHDYKWMVEGFERKTGKRFRYRCKKTILATGTTDVFNRLGVPGEDTQPDWVTHDLNDLETRLDRLVNRQSEGGAEQQETRPVLVVGAGLSAADAVMAARFRGIPVLHVFRDSINEWKNERSEKLSSSYDRLQWLPNSMYPEYHKVYEMMADGGRNYPLYKSLPGYTLVDLNGRSAPIISNGRRTATVCSPDGQLHSFPVSIVAILIGYKPNLSYLDFDGIGLGRNPEKPIDSKSNPIEVDNMTYEVLRAPQKGLYALGPLVGDNFVRFIPGGAFGILTHILCGSET